MLKPLKNLAGIWPKWLEISGTRNELANRKEREAKILAVLNRETELHALDALIYAYKPEPREVNLTTSAIVLDSSAFLRLGPQADVIDYLNSKHQAPVVLPGQAIQEFWNNNLNVADSIATGINKRFDDLKKEVQKVDENFQDFAERFAALIGEFRASFGYAYDGGTVRRTMSLFEILREKAFISYVRRDCFADIALQRKNTKTPPGFKDDQNGDFFIWLDMMDSLLIAKSRNVTFENVVLISNDRKLDWSREGVAHPILSAEMTALFGVPFETWDVAKLIQRVAAANE